MFNNFSYIELVIAVALFSIILLPVLPALGQAQANQRYALLRRQAQGKAVTLALETRANPGNAETIVQNVALGNMSLFYRVRLHPSGDVFVAGNFNENVGLESIGFSTGFGDLFDGVTFIMAEIFDERGVLMGMSVGKVVN